MQGVDAPDPPIRCRAPAAAPDRSPDTDAVDRIAGRHRLGPGWVSHLLQDAVAQLWRTGAVDVEAQGSAFKPAPIVLERIA